MLSIPHGKHVPGLSLRLHRAALAFSLLFPLPFAHAVGLGEYEVQSALGRPLRLVVQVTARADETVEAGCFRIHPFSVASDGLPQLTGAQLALDRRANPQRLIVTSARPILDPIVRVSIDVGCDATLRRDLTLLLDPLPVIETQATTESAPPVGAPIAPAAPAASTAATAEAGPSATASAVGTGLTAGPSGMAAAPTQPGRRPALAAPRARRMVGTADASKSLATPRPPHAVKPPRTQTARQPVPRAPKTASSPPRDRLSISTSGPPLEAVAAAPITPRLTLSTSLSDRSAQPPLPETALSILRQRQARLKAAPTEEDIPSLEAELVVLQRRAAEMRGQLDAMLAQLRSLPEASGTAGTANAPAAQPATAESGTAATPVSALPREAPASRWNWLEPPLLFALLLGLFVVLLIVGGVVWLRRESLASRRAARWNKTPYVPVAAPSAAAPSPSSFGPGLELTAGTAVPPEQQPLPESFTFLPHSTGQAARELGVSDLAQATEKAGVFATLGRPEQAIDVLRDHIDQEPKPSPMAWLMLLDLYRKTGQRSEFTDVAQRFHLEFNAATPAWEQPASLTEAGLGAFPRVVGKIRNDWPKLESRASIEELLYDNRGGSRVGFSLPAFRDLLLLHSIIDEYLQAQEAPARIDPQTGTVALPPPPAPPPHLASVWTAPTAMPPEAPAESPLQLDMGLLSDSTERSALEAGYPIIAEAIATRWGKPGVADYLGKLIQSATDDRGPNLSDETMTELVMLHDIALELGDPQPGYSLA